MVDDAPRVTFRVNTTVYAQMQQLAQRHEQSLSQLCRDAVALLLADPAPYLALLSDRVLARYKRPTPAQAEAAQQLIDAAMAVDLSPLIAASTPPHESCIGEAKRGTP
jgi:hypothetical protein